MSSQCLVILQSRNVSCLPARRSGRPARPMCGRPRGQGPSSKLSGNGIPVAPGAIVAGLVRHTGRTNIRILTARSRMVVDHMVDHVGGMGSAAS
eukprot:3922537-Prymnesium_polylepis.1